MTCLKPVPMYHVGYHPSGKPNYSLAPLKAALTDSPTILVPCGKCLACRFNRRREWADRIISETWLHDYSSFITLTFDDDHLPDKPDKRIVQLFLKRFRKRVKPVDFKYFIVLEYGSLTNRPHFHGVLFGVNLLDDVFDARLATVSDGHPVFTSALLESIWGNGFVSVDVANDAVARYVTKYVLKSLDDKRLWFVFSRNIGLANFVRDGKLTSFALQAIRNGYFDSGSFGCSYKTTLPKALVRKLETIDPALYDTFKSRSRNFAQSEKTDVRSASQRADVLNYRLAKLNEKEKLV